MYGSPQHRAAAEHRELRMSPNLHFKRHKTLPHPTHDRLKNPMLPRMQTHDLSSDHQRPGSSGSQSNTSPRTLKHKTQRIGSGPNLPPTPPTHSRTSSSTQSVQLQDSVLADIDDDGVRTPTRAQEQTPATPTDQRSPPTPDFTPPQPKPRRAVTRPTLGDRGATRSTTGGSRTESFTTAREDPFSSDDEDGGIAIRSRDSRHTSRSTIRQAADVEAYSHMPKPQAITSALERLNGPVDDFNTPNTRENSGNFDNAWARPEGKEEAYEKPKLPLIEREPLPKPAHVQRVDDSEEKDTMIPAKANTAVRKVPHHELTVETSPSKSVSSRSAMSSRLSHSETSASSKPQSSSTRSARSTTSAVVEAVLVSSPPQRQRTLRHVRKQAMLRGSPDHPTVRTLRRQSSPLERAARLSPKPASKQSPRESYDSDARRNSIGSTKSRQDIIKNGGIPVFIIPNRRSSSKSGSSKTPSLRSTDSRHSNKRPASLHSSTFGDRSSQASGPVFERNAQHRRPHSMSISSDRTRDQAPTVPRRSSSLSAPTSRNVSRSGSLTAESLRAHNAILTGATDGTRRSTDYIAQDVLPDPSIVQQEFVQAEYGLHPLVPVEPEKSAYLSSPELEHHEDGRSSQRGHTRNTPFSVSSFATTGTAPELAEATAVPMYQHQGSSILMVDHAARSSEETTGAQNAHVEGAVPIQAETEARAPTTPPQPTFQLEDVDSPLRNPRAPPEPPSHPPTFNFIPATPSGLTPAADKAATAGNYFEVTGGKGSRRPSLMRRAMSKRRHSINYPPSSTKTSGFLTRTLSLTRRPERPQAASETVHPEIPAQDNRLHPFWRPAGAEDEECDSDCECRYEGGRHDDGYYRYPVIDNRPSGPRRTLTQRMKRTFAIMPLDKDDYYYEEQLHGPERRTIGRTPSGNLRVMRQRRNQDSLTDVPRSAAEQREPTRPKTAPDDQPKRSFWRGNAVRRRTSRGNLRRRWSLSSGIGEIQNLPQKISEMRREKRTSELRRKISGPTDVRDGVRDVIRSSTSRKRRSTGPY